MAKVAWIGVQLFERAAEQLQSDIGFFRPASSWASERTTSPHFERTSRCIKSLGIDVRLIEPCDVQGLWPHADLSEYAILAHEPRAGYGDAYLTGRAFAGTAHPNMRWLESASHFSVRAAFRLRHFDVVAPAGLCRVIGMVLDRATPKRSAHRLGG